MNAKAEHILYNDIVYYIKDILQGISIMPLSEILDKVNETINTYNLSKTNTSGFEQLRNDYNQGKKDWYILYILMCYSFNGQYRFNNKQEYNSSFGKQKSCFSEATKSKLFKAKERVDNLDIWFSSNNFVDFDFSDFNERDFVYLDPPYLGSVGNYNDGKRGFEGWNIEYEIKIRSLLLFLNDKGIRWALSNNFAVNTTLKDWCSTYGFKVFNIENTYSNSSYQKKVSSVKDEEVLITNY